MFRLGDSLAAAIELLLRNEESWSRWRTVDGLSIDSVDKVSRFGVGLRGVVLWYDGPKWWIDPFEAVIELEATGGPLARMSATVGDASTGVGKVPHDAKRPPAWDQISDWAPHHYQVTLVV